MTRVRFESTSEPWTEYTLEDGSVVRCRLMVIAAKRREGEFNEQGKPIYDLEMQQIVHIDAAPELCRPQHAGTATKQ
jgi:hypothetical protein